ncbi:MAG: zf-HC2 domain-containing protein [Candidatus Omnitrophica bacterium]|nr:zf-HC2 domain-containing protein [Candidatus Omnitrophota bacterium]
MQTRLERLIKLVYRRHKSELPAYQVHPDEENMACFLEGKLSKEESEQIKLHLIGCQRCAEAFAIQARLNEIEDKPLALDLIARIKDLVKQEDKTIVLEILLRLKEKALELLNTTGDVIVGQELIPAPVLRSRNIKDFKNEVNILKDFQDIRVEAKIENKGSGVFNLLIAVRDKQTTRIIKDLRITLLKDNLELESYLSGLGSVAFEHVLIGKYTIEISAIDKKVASILLDIKT